MGIPDYVKNELKGGYDRHNVKIESVYFSEILAGKKCFEIRKNERDYKEGDHVHLMEWDGVRYTFRKIVVRITYLTDFQQQPGYVVFGFDVLEVWG